MQKFLLKFTIETETKNNIKENRVSSNKVPFLKRQKQILQNKPAEFYYFIHFF